MRMRMSGISRRGAARLGLGIGLGAAAASLAGCGHGEAGDRPPAGPARRPEGPGGAPKKIAPRLIGDGSTSFTGKQPRQPAAATPLEAGQRPPQFVVFSWD